MCKIIAKTKDMPRKQWLQLRKQGIGGSDAGAILGVNPYSSPMDIYINKVKDDVDIDDYDNESMRLGRDLEAYVAERFCEETGLKVRRSNNMYAHKDYPFMIADVDRLVIGKENGFIGLECKTASPYSADKWRDGQIPAHYLAQCYHYMAVLDADAWYIAVVIYGKEFKYIKIERDEEIINNLIQIEKTFWEQNVLAGNMPEPDGSEAANEFINSYFKNSTEALSVKLFGFDDKLKRRMEIDALINKLDTEKKQIDQEVKMYMQDAEIAENENFFVSWKQSVSNRLDTKKLKKEMPDIYEKFCDQVSSRRFLVKTA